MYTGYDEAEAEETAHTVVDTGIVSVVTYADVLAGQFGTLAAQDVTVYTVVE